jgi:hypothetical protein
MGVKELLNLIPEDQIAFLAAETGTDYKSKKLPVSILFKLLLYSQFEVKHNSLRVMGSIFDSYAFSHLAAKPMQQKIHYSSLSERLAGVDANFFEQLYQYCRERFSIYLQPKGSKEEKLLRFDSTLISLSSKLLDIGFRSGGSQQHVKQLKFTIGYAGIPEYAAFHHEATYNGENIALRKAVLNCSSSKGHMVVFDAGLQSRDAYDQFCDQGIRFITRIKVGPLNKPVEKNRLTDPVVGEELTFITDQQTYLYARKGRKTAHTYRYIEAYKTGRPEQTIAFLTNAKELQTQDVAALYKRRWDIEVFFKFLKQELNFSHLLSRSINGIKAVLYVRMILATLILVYQKLNAIKGLKSAKQRFAQELEAELMMFIIRLYGGNPDQPPPASISKFW